MTIFASTRNARIVYFVQAACSKSSIAGMRWTHTLLTSLSLCMNKKWVLKWKDYLNRRIFMTILLTNRAVEKCMMILLMPKSKNFKKSSMIWPNLSWRPFKIYGLLLLDSLRSLKVVMRKRKKWWWRELSKHSKIATWLSLRHSIRLWGRKTAQHW